MTEQRIEMLPEETGIALAYKNKKCIADNILPKVRVDSECFKYKFYAKAGFLGLPDTKIGEFGEPKRVDLKAKDTTASTEDHAIEAAVSKKREEMEAKRGIKTTSYAAKTIQLTSILQTRKEINLSNLLSTASNYAGNVKTLTTAEKISNKNVDAFGLIDDCAQELLYKPNIMITSRKAYAQLRTNPSVIAAAYKNNANSGAVPLELLKEVFEVDNIFVGESICDTSKKQDGSSLEACWKNDIILAHIDENANTEFGATFAYNAVYQDILVGTYFDGRPGTKGADILKASMSYIPLIVCPELGYLIKDAV